MSRQGPTNNPHTGSGGLSQGLVEYRSLSAGLRQIGLRNLALVCPILRRCPVQRNIAEIQPICALRRAVRLRKKASGLRDKLISRKILRLYSITFVARSYAIEILETVI
jgi:hypothetical protein